MNHNFICCFDMETTGKNPRKCQLTQLSAIIIEPRKLEIVDNGIFNSEIKPIFDNDAAIAAGYDPVEQEALDVTHKTREQLEKAPSIETVWSDFVNFIQKYKKGNDKSNWANPIRAGFNIVNFDNIIVDRMCSKYGPYDEKYGSQKLFHPLHNFDLLHDFWRLTDNDKINNNNSLSLDSIRDWLGMDRTGSHDALNDVIDCSELLIRMMKKYRKVYQETQFEGALADWKRPKLSVML